MEWDLDFYRCPLVDSHGRTLWHLLMCRSGGEPLLEEFCPADEATATWLGSRLRQLAASEDLPLEIRTFRETSYELASPACRAMGVPLRVTHRAIAIQRWRNHQEQVVYPRLPGYRSRPPGISTAPSPVPHAMPDEWLPEHWGFSVLPGAELERLQQMPIEFLVAPPLGVSFAVPGVFLVSPTRSRGIARWLAAQEPVNLLYMSAEIDGLLLDTEQGHRWIVATFEQAEMRERAHQFRHQLGASGGLHFLAVGPDEGDGRLNGFWLLQIPFG